MTGAELQGTYRYEIEEFTDFDCIDGFGESGLRGANDVGSVGHTQQRNHYHATDPGIGSRFEL